ncbi:MAG: DUF5819 family protein [Pseudonocardiaceae bacterium]
MSPSSSRSARAIIVAACLVIGSLLSFHFIMTFLYVAPRNAISARADKAIGSYILPYLDQDWKLFAPDPGKTDPHVLVRAKVVDAMGRQQVTSWLDITRPELARVKGHLFPDRVSRLSAKTAESLFGTAEQQERAPASDEAFAHVLATRAARAQWGKQVTEVQIRLDGHIPASPSFGSQDAEEAKVIQHQLPWWPVTPTTPAELQVWKEIHR